MATDKLIPIPIEDEMKTSYLAYAMSVIVSRALPDARDGLKPVHRRILYAMREEGLTPDKAFKKCAATVGEVLKSFHPHGDQSVYDALVRMAQPFNLRYTLVDGHGNFGSIDGDPPAAMRYTESRLAKIAMEMLEDLDKDTVDWQDNFDNTQQEPKVLPAKLPNLLLNGSTGIAVGMATNIPPHNLGEVVDAIVRMIDEPGVSDEVLFRIVPAPDFPTGGLILGNEGAQMAYRTGRGSVTMRARTTIEEIRANKHAIIVTEIPYQVNKTRLIEQIAELVKDKRIQGITDLRDESDRRGMRIVIELSNRERPQVVLNNLFKHSQLQQNFGVINLALVDGEPRVLTLRECLEIYLEHRQEVVRRRTEYELNKARKRAHILEGLQRALDHLDEIIALIRGSASPDAARTGLISQFQFSEEQANAILDMRLQRLTGLERDRLAEEYRQVREYMTYLEGLLADPARILAVIRVELMEIRGKYADPRRSEIVAGESGGFNKDDLIPPQDIIVSVSHAGYIKRQPTAMYKAQRRGGRGITGTGLKEEDFVEHILVTNTHHYLMFITTKARAYRLKGYDIPEAGRQAKGTALVNLIDIEPDEKIMAVISVGDMSANAFIFMTTRLGYVKRTHLLEFANLRNRGLIALTLEEGDELVGARVTTGDDQILLITRKGMSIRFREADVRGMGRAARGVHGMKLREEDEIVAMTRIEKAEGELLVITEKGYGKRTSLTAFRLQTRGGLGLRSMNIEDERRGAIVSARVIDPELEIIVCTQEGIVIRVPAQEISEQGRGAQGVRLIRLSEGDHVSSIAAVPKEEEILEEGDEEAVEAAEEEAASGGEEAVQEIAEASEPAPDDPMPAEPDAGDAIG